MRDRRAKIRCLVLFLHSKERDLHSAGVTGVPQGDGDEGKRQRSISAAIWGTMATPLCAGKVDKLYFLWEI